MKIKLIKSGGFVGTRMSATTEWKLPEKDWDEMVSTISRKEGPGKMRDAFSYSVQKGDDEKTRVPVSIQNIPAEFDDIFKELLAHLKAEKL